MTWLTLAIQQWLVALLAQDKPAAVFGGQEPVAGDFRGSVWIAYGVTLLLLAAFTVFVVLRNQAVNRRIAHLEERFERAQEKKTEA